MRSAAIVGRVFVFGGPLAELLGDRRQFGPPGGVVDTSGGSGVSGGGGGGRGRCAKQIRTSLVVVAITIAVFNSGGEGATGALDDEGKRRLWR